MLGSVSAGVKEVVREAKLTSELSGRVIYGGRVNTD